MYVSAPSQFRQRCNVILIIRTTLIIEVVHALDPQHGPVCDTAGSQRRRRLSLRRRRLTICISSQHTDQNRHTGRNESRVSRPYLGLGLRFDPVGRSIREALGSDREGLCIIGRHFVPEAVGLKERPVWKAVGLIWVDRGMLVSKNRSLLGYYHWYGIY